MAECLYCLGQVLTFNIDALLSPVTTKTALRAAFSKGRVIVMRFGGGFGESLIGAIILLCSCFKTDAITH